MYARCVMAAMLTMFVAAPLVAQAPAPGPAPAAAHAASSVQERSGWRPLAVAKWTTAAAAAGAAVYGVVQNRRADHQYEDLEQVCVEEPFRCEERLPNGAYADAELEARYQDVRDLDGRARAALIAGQIGVAASVVLFILDLRNSDGPQNIPYEPRTFDVMPARDGGLSLRLNLRLPASN